VDNLSREELLRQIQMLDFYAVELNLFLDTHPTDQQALQDYRYVLQQTDQLRKVYTERFGPLLNFQKAEVIANKWNWIEEPWPWENKKEGAYVGL
jgi:spore coat protein JB